MTNVLGGLVAPLLLDREPTRGRLAALSLRGRRSTTCGALARRDV